MANAIANSGNLREVYNDCSSKAPTGQIRYIKPDAAEIKQGKIVRDEAAVKKAQEALGIKGKDADGMWGDKTTEAAQRRIEQFQRDNGLSVTGRYTAETAEKMKLDPANKALKEALDGMRNRNLLERVYKPLQKEVGGPDEAMCRREGGTTGSRLGGLSVEGEGLLKAKPGLTPAELSAKREDIRRKFQGLEPVTRYETPEAAERGAEIRRKFQAQPGEITTSLKQLGLASNIDKDPQGIAGINAATHKALMEHVQGKAGLPVTGALDAKTEQALKAGAANGEQGYKALSEQVQRQKEAGLIRPDGKWDEKRDVAIRLQAFEATKPGTNLDDAKIKIAPATAPAAAGMEGGKFMRLDQGEGIGRTMRLDQGAGVGTLQNVLSSFQTDNAGSIGSLGRPSLATPGIVADTPKVQSIIRIDTPKL